MTETKLQARRRQQQPGSASRTCRKTRLETRREEGFTLVEVMVVVAIIGLLTTFVVINVLPAQGVAERQKAEADIALIDQALQLYRINNRRYPTTAQGLAALEAEGALRRLPDDPWGQPYQYQYPGTRGGEYDVFSLGADGQPGGEDEAADIGNWDA
ncbi:type II secretion system protein GspG [Pacificimonas flava]|uniref:Type II secretion system core protein G n=2 Tax=Pacificimonas TaxID=1960290 RepID=A0A219B060_9SPHN|nr:MULTISPECIES: type II secretion system major pseudopilin GspG [Pacificimonas]MBZ6379794.1 type II secretion system major pseudopilin GspG [Pacificimonas aurantium]OWV31752.1 type II secretion system protein GspG [Pacificimonas flava]